MMRRARRLVAGITLLCFGTLATIGPGGHFAPIFGIHSSCASGSKCSHQTGPVTLCSHGSSSTCTSDRISTSCSSAGACGAAHRAPGALDRDIAALAPDAQACCDRDTRAIAFSAVVTADQCQFCQFYAQIKLPLLYAVSSSKVWVDFLTAKIHNETHSAASEAYLARGPPIC